MGSDFFIGIATGLISSVIIWLVFSKAVRPKLRISTFISKTTSLVGNEMLFRIKAENQSWFKIYDVGLLGRIHAYGLKKGLPDKPYTFVALIGSGSHPYIEGQREKQALDTTGREFLVRPTKKTKQDLARLWKIPESEVNIETILKNDERNDLEVSIVGVHGFSGARRTFLHQYRGADILPYYFMQKGTEPSQGKCSFDSIDDDCIEEQL